ncbi:BnaC02g43660D [Brassica napus]|uniref:BnaC02g43660D protein n=1 Tax=Brassica napus TaxID=3708 RepID=A0A078H812_BRANA|nr:BnaC02g43660D [Brassica napus]
MSLSFPCRYAFLPVSYPVRISRSNNPCFAVRSTSHRDTKQPCGIVELMLHLPDHTRTAPLLPTKKAPIPMVSMSAALFLSRRCFVLYPPP